MANIKRPDRDDPTIRVPASLPVKPLHRRTMPEPPPHMRQPKPTPAPAPRPVQPAPWQRDPFAPEATTDATNVIPISRARTANPVFSQASRSGWDMAPVAGAPADAGFDSENTFVDRSPPMFLRGTSTSGNAAVAVKPAQVVLPALPPPVVAPLTVPPARSGGSKWAAFEQLGLVPPTKLDTKQKTQKALVGAYRVLGFVVLSIIVIVLVWYIATAAFYFLSDTWIQPMKVSRTDERALALSGQLVEQQNLRDRIVADLAHADRYIAVQQAYQAEFARAIRADLEGRRVALDKVRELAKGYAGARSRVQRSNQAYASASRKQMAQEYAAGLIDRNDMLSGKFQLAQITSSNLSLAERQAEYENRAAELETEARALDAILAEKGDAAFSYDVLKIKQEYEMSRLESAKAIEGREALESSLVRQDAVLASLRQSPWLRALADGANVAFVPYDNLDNVAIGTSIHSCALEMIACSEVGKVIEVLPGEVTFKHPHREKILRGQMIVIEVEDADATEEDVLFVGGAPLLL